MRKLLITAAFIVLAGCTSQAGTTLADSETVGDACVDVSGQFEPAACDLKGPTVNGSSLGFCTCPATSRRIEASFCAKGSHPPVDNTEYNAAVREAIAKDSSLVGDTFQGKPMCIAPRST
jgi:hypothetical protein